MLRLTILALTLGSLAPMTPLGCPPATDFPDDNATDQRAVLSVAATADTIRADASQLVTLSATASGENDPGPMYYAWIQIGGPGVAIAQPNQPTATFTAPSLAAERALTFLVTARSEAGAVGQAQLNVFINPDPNYGQGLPDSADDDPIFVGPAAEAGPNERVLPGQLVTLDGTGSRGDSLTYSWRQVSGPAVMLESANTAQATFTAPAYDQDDDRLVFQLSVTDVNGTTVPDRVTITVGDPDASDRVVRMSTTLGDIVIELNPEAAPVTVENFLQYVDDDFYDGTIFHRVIPNFVIQGGGFEPGLNKKETRDPIINEADNGLSNTRGTISMARLADPDTATSQFFINLANNVEGGDGNSNLDPGGVSPDGYAVFGEVIQGLDVVDRIAVVETGTVDGFQDVPLEDVIILTVERE